MRSKPPGHDNQVRIIGGEFRRRVLHFPDATGLRPTPDRVRETLFNWLGQDLTGMTCLDVFAGSGALGFEAASRNAARVVMLEFSRPVSDALKQNRDVLKADKIEIVQAEARAWMRNCREQFDLILLDPPFASGLMDEALTLAAGLLKPGGWIYVEQDGKLHAPEGFIIHREGRAGQSHFGLLKGA
jgi:16S rRNA (guanine966-N2)-methyltransferase